ncbi:TetR/AcrR family transcriptional regulator [Agrobacterium rhizogenes]|uniref:TetR/AcrR family transcriptional regulator n=1 Tax=Rhizobium rhizogenes TaxID=359 RepID=UPI001571C9EC|nr:TetR/AcrR family transcriptional regulator [Rhizobium rhizogenes]NTF52771.1 TetR/AcrR family transcriptional regulator [Rhizobium rhizogenes]NTF65981.1 TetR/AcrR family transcriptional regulator [Rhizobium rhizogenes]NTF98092.1 TetR/AcrR family transcriptional regulator [Rhizobium rhizogenes]NTG05203.1 TetR/AcrR family transcriptional regulator [Rhizobium rhizogenes]NTG18497.1 TetR/AcrR family transcriptional regulator [Rhizobium rhizogenes]
MSNSSITLADTASHIGAKPYHHGNLVEALLAAAIELIEAEGLEKLSIRDVAKRVGVSPGAPFRHFRTKADLLTAVAEQSMARLTASVQDALATCSRPDPIARLTAIGRGYLKWALGNPTHFQIISSRTLIRFEESDALVQQNNAIRLLMLELVSAAQMQGLIRRDVPAEDFVLNARAFAYGLARMATDGHFPEWHVTQSPEVAAENALRLYLEMLTGREPKG